MQTCLGRFVKFYVMKANKTQANFITDTALNPLQTEVAPNLKISYTLALGEVYVLNWNRTVPEHIKIQMTGLNT